MDFRERKTENGKLKDESLCQASESQVYLSFYSERSQGSSPRSGVKVSASEQESSLLELLQ